jgi:membrane protein DedA with SNARE-associated domain
MSGVIAESFITLNAVSALLWAAVVGTGAYFFGSALEAVIGDIERHELAVVLAVAFAGISMWLLWYWRKRADLRVQGQSGDNSGGDTG